jgi:hypothetical protein
MEKLHEQLRAQECQVVILDPMYLCLEGVQMNNLVEVGSRLRTFCLMCQDVPCTPVFVHHTLKHIKPTNEPLQLSDLAFAGFAEFARQWLLIRRRTYYRNDGKHDLILSCGGSAGHGEMLSVSVDEGKERGTDLKAWDIKCEEYRPGNQGASRDASRTERRKQLKDWLLEQLLRFGSAGITLAWARRELDSDKARTQTWGREVRDAAEELQRDGKVTLTEEQEHPQKKRRGRGKVWVVRLRS